MSRGPGCIIAKPSPPSDIINSRSLREDWPITREQREGIVARAVEDALHGRTASIRHSAMRALIMMDRMNERRERNEQDSSHQTRAEDISVLRTALSDPRLQPLLDKLRQESSQGGVPPPALLEREIGGEGEQEASLRAENSPSGCHSGMGVQGDSVVEAGDVSSS